MKTFLLYCYLEFKRIARLIPGICAVTFLVLLLAAAILQTRGSTDREKITVGVVKNEEETPFIGMGLSMIQETAELKDLMTFTEVTEEEGQQMLDRGELTALAIFQENYVLHAYHGTEEPIVVRFGTSQSGMSSILFRQLADVITDYLMIARAGVFAMQDSCREAGIPYRDAANQLSSIYLLQILARMDMLQIQKTYAHDTDTLTHYLCAGTVLLLLFWGMTCGSIIGRNSGIRSVLLSRNILPAALQYPAKLLSLCAMFFCNLLFTGGILLAAVRLLHIEVFPDIFLILRMLPLLLLLSALVLLIFDRSGDGIGGMLFFFFGTVISSLLSGFFYPISIFPHWVQQASELLPARVMLKYMIHLCTEDAALSALLPVLLYTAALAAAALSAGHLSAAKSGT